MGRLSGLKDFNNADIVNNVTYGPAGQLLTLSWMNYTETRQYNNLLQMTRLTATYGYDGFGNLLQKTPVKGSGVPLLNIAVDPWTNRVTGLSGGSYDANGNDLTAGAFDIANRLKQSGSTYFQYDAANKRVWKGTVGRFASQLDDGRSSSHVPLVACRMPRRFGERALRGSGAHSKGERAVLMMVFTLVPSRSEARHGPTQASSGWASGGARLRRAPTKGTSLR